VADGTDVANVTAQNNSFQGGTYTTTFRWDAVGDRQVDCQQQCLGQRQMELRLMVPAANKPGLVIQLSLLMAAST
jgi:hypothetical protein